MLIDDNYIIKYFLRSDGSIKGACLTSRIINTHKEIRDYMLNRFSFTNDYKEIYYLIYHHINSRPCCPVCGNEMKFIKFGLGYRTFCSVKCRLSEKGRLLLAEHLELTCLERYGVKSTLSLDDIKNRRFATNMIRYGGKSPMNSEVILLKLRNIFMLKYGVFSPMLIDEVKDKVKQTCLERYGVENVMLDEKFVLKARLTCLEKYGIEIVLRLDSIKLKTLNTCLKRYGACSPLCNDEVKLKAIQTLLERYGVDNAMKSKDIRLKVIETCLEKYGVANYTLTDEYKEKYKKTCLDKYGVDNTLKLEKSRKRAKQVIRERYGVDNVFSNLNILKRALENSLKSTSSKSLAEDDIYLELCKEYGKDDIIRLYSSEVYPFHCDFYIISKDLYIEYLGSWTHGNKAYNDKDKVCELQLLEWKEKAKTSDYYKDAIETWTVRDVEKRNIARNNKLNYIELW